MENSLAEIRFNTLSNRAYFYDLYIVGAENLEREIFLKTYKSVPEMMELEEYIATLEAPSIRERVIPSGFFRTEDHNEKKFVAIPGKREMKNRRNRVIKNSKIGLRLFCYKLTPKTIIYLNGYKHTNKRNERWQDTYFREKGEELQKIMGKLEECRDLKKFRMNDNGAILSPEGTEMRTLIILKDVK